MRHVAASGGPASPHTHQKLTTFEEPMTKEADEEAGQPGEGEQHLGGRLS